MDWKEILTILVPLLSMMAWVYNRIDKRFELIDKKFDKIDQKFDKIDQKFDKIDQRFDKIDQRFDKVDDEIDSTREGIHNLDTRISRIEGQLMPRLWEPKIIEKKEE